MTRLSRRSFLRALAAAAPVGCISAPPRLGSLELSAEAQALVDEAWAGIDPSQVVDVHCHVIGLGVGGTGCYVHPDALSLAHPLRWVKSQVYMSASGIYDTDRADALFVDRLVDLCRSQRPRGKALLLAFDQHHGRDGTPLPEHSEFHTPNDYVLDLAQQWPGLFLPACSIHPYRPDAIDELERCAERGAVALKWLPNAQGIDPLQVDVRFYERLAELGIPLLSHAGEEQAVDAEEAQALGNPLRLRPALDAGATVIVGHCASLGTDEDLDAAPDASGRRPRPASYSLFRRLLRQHPERLYGGVSAMTQFNRCRGPLAETLASTGIHDRLVNGSDYPLPAIDVVIRTGLLCDLGYLDPEERPLVNELFAYNPLLFDFVLKRRLRFERGGETYRFPASVFETRHVLRS